MRSTVHYTLSLHDALPIFALRRLLEGTKLEFHVLGPKTVGIGPTQASPAAYRGVSTTRGPGTSDPAEDRKSTRLNSSHPSISYAVFCLKKKTTTRPASAPR